MFDPALLRTGLTCFFLAGIKSQRIKEQPRKD